MSSITRLWLAVAGLAAVCALVVGGIAWYRGRTPGTAALLNRLPVREAVVVYVDFAALRQSGLLDMLAGSGVAEEPEYREFVKRTSFDYQKDLNSALVAFAPQAKYFLLRGRFDWNRLSRYAVAEHGECRNQVCRMAGSLPERRISFYPPLTGLLALAVSPDPSAVMVLYGHDEPSNLTPPPAPVWISIPPPALRSAADLPAGTRLFARSMENARGVMLTLGPEGQSFFGRMDVTASSVEDAATIAAQLEKTTATLLDLIRREHQQPNPADLSGVLTSGTFHASGTHVQGYWPIQRSFVTNLLGGATNR